MAAGRRYALRTGSGRLLDRADGRTLKAVADRWLQDATDGTVRNRSGDPYKPSALRAYRASLQLHVYPTLADRRFIEIEHKEMQNLVDRLHQDGWSANRVSGIVLPLKALYRWAMPRIQGLERNPTSNLEMPATARQTRPHRL